MTIALLAAGCRGEYPPLSAAPSGPPAALIAARDAAAADRSRLAALAGDAESPTRTTDPTLRPAKLLAAMPADRPAPPGVIDRAESEARSSGRPLRIVSVGAGAEALADQVALMFRSRGLVADVDATSKAGAGPARVELYLAP